MGGVPDSNPKMIQVIYIIGISLIGSKIYRISHLSATLINSFLE